MREKSVIRLNQRIYSDHELCGDESVKRICYVDLTNWEQTHSWHTAVRHLPLESHQIKKLQDDLFSSTYFAIYEIHDPTILVYRWPTGEFRYFLMTKTNYLVEPKEWSVWDKSFPFLQFNCGQEDGCISIPNSFTVEYVSDWIWFPNHKNYTHFLFDAFAQVALASEYLSDDEVSNYVLPIIEAPPAWQKEFFSRLPYQTCHLQWGNLTDSFRVFKPKTLLLPVLSQKAYCISWLRKYFCNTYSSEVKQMPSNTAKKHSLVFITRHDNRRKRVMNIEELEELVSSYGGNSMDASQMTVHDKVKYFSNCKIIIAENSGSINAALFGPLDGIIIYLVEPGLIKKEEFLVGCWPYLIGFASRTTFMVGESEVYIPGSPVSGSYYPINQIDKLIRDCLVGS